MRATTPLGFQDGAGAAAHAKARLTHWRTMLVVFVGSSSSTLASMMRVATMVIWRASALPPSAERSCERWTADGVSSLSACVEQRCRSVHTHTREMMRFYDDDTAQTHDRGQRKTALLYCALLPGSTHTNNIGGGAAHKRRPRPHNHRAHAAAAPTHKKKTASVSLSSTLGVVRSPRIRSWRALAATPRHAGCRLAQGRLLRRHRSRRAPPSTSRPPDLSSLSVPPLAPLPMALILLTHVSSMWRGGGGGGGDGGGGGGGGGGAQAKSLRWYEWRSWIPPSTCAPGVRSSKRSEPS